MIAPQKNWWSHRTLEYPQRQLLLNMVLQNKYKRAASAKYNRAREGRGGRGGRGVPGIRGKAIGDVRTNPASWPSVQDAHERFKEPDDNEEEEGERGERGDSGSNSGTAGIEGETPQRSSDATEKDLVVGKCCRIVQRDNALKSTCSNPHESDLPYSCANSIKYGPWIGDEWQH